MNKTVSGIKITQISKLDFSELKCSSSFMFFWFESVSVCQRSILERFEEKKKKCKMGEKNDSNLDASQTSGSCSYSQWIQIIWIELNRSFIELLINAIEPQPNRFQRIQHSFKFVHKVICILFMHTDNVLWFFFHMHRTILHTTQSSRWWWNNASKSQAQMVLYCSFHFFCLLGWADLCVERAHRHKSLHLQLLFNCRGFSISIYLHIDVDCSCNTQ